MKALPIGWAAGVALFAGQVVWAGDCSEPGLGQNLAFTNNGVEYNISHTTDPASTHCVSLANVSNIQANLIGSYGIYANEMGFRTPYLNTMPDYNVILKNDWWYAEPGCVVLHAFDIRNESEEYVRNVTFHERFHTVQRHYRCDVADCDSGYMNGTFGSWTSEGSNDAMMDKGYPDLDDLTGYPFYENSAHAYLNAPYTSLFDQAYHACLFWNYAMEQFGTVHVEPRYGVDFLRRFYERFAANGSAGSASSRAALEQTVAAAGGPSLHELFLDFSICNYARSYDTTALANGARYRYVDEQTQPILGSVPIQAIAALPATGNDRSITNYSARFYEYVMPEAGGCEVVGFKADDARDVMGFAAVAVNAAGRVIAIRKGIGTEFAATFFNAPTQAIRRLCGIAVGLEEDTTFDYVFARGTLTCGIVRPVAAHPAYPGPHAAAGLVLVRTRVVGVSELEPDAPGTLSVLGLTATNFNVYIADLPAPIVDANYVGGEYQLLVAAPDPGADGKYDLRVELCEDKQGGVSAASPAAVEYGDLRCHHVVCLDVSGSMTYPTSAKLDAAKEAAKFYIDAVTTNDKITVVKFSGDLSECNEDADNLKASGGLYAATSGNRTALRNAVDALPSENMTSIGDGLWTSQDALDLAATNTYLHTDAILLLSDGKENEARYWARTNCIAAGQTVAGRLTNSASMVNSIAFGSDADHGLMQLIGDSTDGDYSYIPVDEYGVTAPGSGGPFALGATPMPNALALRFLQGVERAKGLQRLAYGAAGVAAGAKRTIDLNLGEDEVTKGLLYAGWNNPGKMTVAFTDPNGLDPRSYAIGIYTTATHVILHFKDPLPKGLYGVTLDNGSGLYQECFAGISGVPGSGLAIEFSFAQHKTGGIEGGADSVQELFEQGLPVDMRALVYDRKGPVRDAEARLQVILPDGPSACEPMALFDDGRNVDGGWRDGVYGLRYGRTPLAALAGGSNDETPATHDLEKDSGNYRVTLTVQGKANDGSEFERVLERTFQVYRREKPYDSDGDGLPDTWEVYYGTKPTGEDEKEDYDHDGLDNTAEFELGTHPYDPDTDNGGESDGSEAKAGRCPLNPLDDDLPPLTEAGIITTPDSPGQKSGLMPYALLLQFPDHAAYTALHVYRSTNPADATAPSNLVKTLNLAGKIVTSWFDEGLIDGQRYYYRLQAEGASGALTPFSRLLTAVAKADPYAPAGHVSLNRGVRKTDTLKLRVDLRTDGTAAEYRLSQNPAFAGAVYTTLVGNAAYTLTGVSNRQTAVLYAQFRGPARRALRAGARAVLPGNESDVTTATIQYVTDEDNDGDGRLDPDDPDDDNDKISDDDEINLYGTNPYRADTDGDGFGDNTEVQSGSDPTDASSMPDDFDGDRIPNNLEDAYGTDPWNPAAMPDLRLNVVAAYPDYSLMMGTASGVMYQIQSALALSNAPGGPWQDDGSPVQSDGSTLEQTFPYDQLRRFHRVVIWAP